MRIMLIIFFPLLGMFDYLRMQDLRIMGYLVFMLPICASIFYVAILKPKFSVRPSCRLQFFNRLKNINLYHASLFLIYILVVLIGFVRAIYVGAREGETGIAESTVFLGIVLFFYIVVVDAINEGYYDSLLAYFGGSLFLLMLANVIGAAIGITNHGIEENYNRLIDNPYWVTGYRVIFPFMTSGQMLAIQAGVLVISGVFKSLAKRNKNIVVGPLMIGIGAVVLLGQGGRAAMAILVGVLVFMVLWKISRRTLALVLALFLLFPVFVVMGNIGNELESVANKFDVPISRTEGDVSSFSNRDKIFSIVVLSLYKADMMSLLFGYSAYGQVASGVSDYYSQLFMHSYLNPFGMSAHNTVLQFLLDYGVLGLGVLVLLVFSLAKSIKRIIHCRKKNQESETNAKLMIALLLYLLGTSMTEASISYYSFGVLSIFIFLNALVLFDRDSIQSKTECSKPLLRFPK